MSYFDATVYETIFYILLALRRFSYFVDTIKNLYYKFIQARDSNIKPSDTDVSIFTTAISSLQPF